MDDVECLVTKVQRGSGRYEDRRANMTTGVRDFFRQNTLAKRAVSSFASTSLIGSAVFSLHVKQF